MAEAERKKNVANPNTIEIQWRSSSKWLGDVLFFVILNMVPCRSSHDCEGVQMY